MLFLHLFYFVGKIFLKFNIYNLENISNSDIIAIQFLLIWRAKFKSGFCEFEI